MTHPIPFLSAADVGRLVSMADTIEGLRSTFVERRTSPERVVAPFDNGNLLTMPAVAGGLAGAKVITLVPSNAQRGLPVIQGVYVLFSEVDGRVRALLDGACLTARRTPAASALAADYLAPPAPVTIGIIGAGVQGRGHVDAMRSIRPTLTTVLVSSRTPQSADDLVVYARSQGLEAHVAEAAVAARCDIVCCCTSAVTPVMPERVADGAFVSAIGAYLPDQAELPPALIGGADVWVDAEAAARAEAGDLIQAVSAGQWAWDQLCGDLVTLVTDGARRPPTGRPQLFKSVGLSIEDLALAKLTADRAGVPA